MSKGNSALNGIGSTVVDIKKKKQPAMQQKDVNLETNIAKPYMDSQSGTPVNKVLQSDQVTNDSLWMENDGTSQTAKGFTNMSGLALLGSNAAAAYRNTLNERDQIEEYRNREQQALSKNAYDTLNSSKQMGMQASQNVMDQANRAGRNALQAGLAKMHNTGGEGNMAALASTASDRVYSQGVSEASNLQAGILANGYNSFGQQMAQSENAVQNLYKGDNPLAATTSAIGRVPYDLNEAAKLGLESIQNRDLTHNAMIDKPEILVGKPGDPTKPPMANLPDISNRPTSEIPGTSTVDRLSNANNTMEMLGLAQPKQEENKPFYMLGNNPIVDKKKKAPSMLNFRT